jgi:hypothetical protein
MHFTETPGAPAEACRQRTRRRPSPPRGCGALSATTLCTRTVSGEQAPSQIEAPRSTVRLATPSVIWPVDPRPVRAPAREGCARMTRRSVEFRTRTWHVVGWQPLGLHAFAHPCLACLLSQQRLGWCANCRRHSRRRRRGRRRELRRWRGGGRGGGGWEHLTSLAATSFTAGRVGSCKG